MTTTTTAPEFTPSPFFLKERDKYGRTTYSLVLAARCLGAVVRLPRAAVESRTDGAKYLANAWGKGDDGRGLVTYHATLAAAKAWLAEEQGVEGTPETIT